MSACTGKIKPVKKVNVDINSVILFPFSNYETNHQSDLVSQLSRSGLENVIGIISNKEGTGSTLEILRKDLLSTLAENFKSVPVVEGERFFCNIKEGYSEPNRAEQFRVFLNVSLKDISPDQALTETTHLEASDAKIDKESIIYIVDENTSFYITNNIKYLKFVEPIVKRVLSGRNELNGGNALFLGSEVIKTMSIFNCKTLVIWAQFRLSVGIRPKASNAAKFSKLLSPSVQQAFSDLWKNTNT